MIKSIGLKAVWIGGFNRKHLGLLRVVYSLAKCRSASGGSAFLFTDRFYYCI